MGKYLKVCTVFRKNWLDKIQFSTQRWISTGAVQRNAQALFYKLTWLCRPPGFRECSRGFWSQDAMVWLFEFVSSRPAVAHPEGVNVLTKGSEVLI